MDTGELTFRRIHDAPPELLFDCMTRPEHLTHFWGPAGTTTPVESIVVDLRPGGAFETTMVNVADGSTYTMRAVYAEIRRPELLEWIEPGVEGGMRTTVTFIDLRDGRTEVVTHQTNVPAAYLSAQARAGFNTSLDRFDAYLARLNEVTSADGTVIGYERTGSGPALVLVDGAMCYRGAGPLGALAAVLRDGFTVYTYDRRGRGASGDTLPYAVAREVEDLRAVIARAGGTAYVYGISSGAALALLAAATGPGIARLALYEPPYRSDVDDGGRGKEYTQRLRELLDAGRRGDAVALFMAHVGMPEQAIAGMRAQPGWPAFEAIAPTLAYDDEILGEGTVPRDAAARVSAPALVLAGGASPAFLRDAARATAAALCGGAQPEPGLGGDGRPQRRPAAGFRELDGQTHDVALDALAPVLREFFAG
ncbi:MAG TPA: alpha/beta fold hydrolase [Rugosimonospora sp.]|nr:alpha/beta fold hydrolase [Rugosimonospora sp.]